MIPAPKHPLESERQAAVDELELTLPSFVEAYDSVAHMLKIAAQAPIALFSVLDRDRQFFKACVGLDGVRETPREQSFCAHAIVQEDLDQIFVVEDATKDTRFSDNPLVTGTPNIRFYAGIVIRAPSNGLPVGTLCLIDRAPRASTQSIEEILLHGRKLVESHLRLMADATRDPLTGLFNRRFLKEMMEREWRKAYRQSLPLSVLVIDIDHFKSFNDHYGHHAGDEALRAVGRTLGALCARPGDVAVRYGGEEFLVLLPDTDVRGTQVVASKIVDAVYNLGIRHTGSSTGFVTASVGAAVVHSRPVLEAGIDQAILVADEAMYTAKYKGRNGFFIREINNAQDLSDHWTQRTLRPFS